MDSIFKFNGGTSGHAKTSMTCWHSLTASNPGNVELSKGQNNCMQVNKLDQYGGPRL